MLRVTFIMPDKPVEEPVRQPDALAEPSLAGLEPSLARESSGFVRLQNMIRTLNTPIEVMPKPFQDEYRLLCDRKNPDGTSMGDEDFEQRSEQFMKNLQAGKDSPLTDEQRKKIDEVEQAISSGDITPKDALSALKEYANNPANNVDEREEANRALAQIEHEVDEPSEGSPYRIKESLGKLLHILKYLGIAIAALLGFGALKGIMGGRK